MTPSADEKHAEFQRHFSIAVPVEPREGVREHESDMDGRGPRGA